MQKTAVATKKRGRGRPRVMANCRRIIIQVEEKELQNIQSLVKNQISVSQFFRDAADFALANPTVVFNSIKKD